MAGAFSARRFAGHGMNVLFCSAYLSAGDLFDVSPLPEIVEAKYFPLRIGVDLSLYCIVMSSLARTPGSELTVEIITKDSKFAVASILLPVRYRAPYAYCLNLCGLEIAEPCRILATTSPMHRGSSTLKSIRFREMHKVVR